MFHDWFAVFAIARLVLDSKTQRPKGFGFVTYESEVEAEKALKAMNGRVIRNFAIYLPLVFNLPIVLLFVCIQKHIF